MRCSGAYLCLAVAVCAFGAPVAAQTILNRSYTSVKLERFWQSTLGATEPDPAWYQMLAPGNDMPEPASPAPEARPSDVPFFGVVIGEDATTPEAGPARTAFPVIPLSAEDASVLMRRLAWVEIYLSRYRFFEKVSTDTDAILDTLIARQYAAGVEAYLIQARLYFSAPDLPTKCNRITRARALEAGALSGFSEQRLPPGWRPLAEILDNARARLDTGPLAALVCAVQPVRTRGEMAELVTAQVRTRIMAEVEREVRNTLDLLEAASTEFQTLVNAMDVTINSAEILELERVLGNARANMMLVKQDQLRAAETITTLKDVDLSSLDQPTELAEYEQAQARMTQMVALIDGVLTALADLEQIADDPDITAELAPCANLRGAYAALDTSRDTGVLETQIIPPYEDCLARARSVVTRFQIPSLRKAQMAALAAHVRQLSEAFLTSGGP